MQTAEKHSNCVTTECENGGVPNKIPYLIWLFGIPNNVYNLEGLSESFKYIKFSIHSECFSHLSCTLDSPSCSIF